MTYEEMLSSDLGSLGCLMVQPGRNHDGARVALLPDGLPQGLTGLHDYRVDERSESLGRLGGRNAGIGTAGLALSQYACTG
jgi:hypothetical protein